MAADPKDIRFSRRGAPVVIGTAPPRAPRRTGARASTIYHALEKGGDLAEIAARFDVPPSVLRQHIKQREDTGKWTFVVTDWRTIKRSGRKVAAAGRLYHIMC